MILIFVEERKGVKYALSLQTQKEKWKEEEEKERKEKEVWKRTNSSTEKIANGSSKSYS